MLQLARIMWHGAPIFAYAALQPKCEEMTAELTERFGASFGFNLEPLEGDAESVKQLMAAYRETVASNPTRRIILQAAEGIKQAAVMEGQLR